MRKVGHIAAFTLFEMTVVLAIMSILISIIAVSLNRFNEQLKQSSDLQGELNQWYQFRANLWRELYVSDSLVMDKEILSIYKGKIAVQYKVDEEILLRKIESTDWQSTNIPTETIKENLTNENRFLEFNFLWKGDPLKLTYLCQESSKNKIDTYFEQLP